MPAKSAPKAKPVKKKIPTKANSNGNGNGKPPPRQRKKYRSPGVTTLQTVPKKHPGGHNAKTSETRKLFLHAFANTFGNITASCEYAGITRPTYYRWINSHTRINKKFQNSIEAIKPIERQVDFLEAALMGRVTASDTTAIIFGLKTRGSHRGWAENGRNNMNQADLQTLQDAAVRAVMSYQLWLKDNPTASEPEKGEWLRRFASVAGADEKEVVRTMKIQELTASIQ